MEGHVKILGILYLALSVLGVLAAILLLVLFGGVAGIVGSASQGDPDARIAVPVLGAIGGGLALVVLVVSVPGILAGFGLLNFHPWARTLTIVLSALNLLNVPIGTAIGAYGLWVLLNDQTEALFRARR